MAVHGKSKQPPEKHVSMSERVYRVKVVENFLKAGIPLAKIDDLRVLLEESGVGLTHSSIQVDYIPLLLRQEKEVLCKDVEGKPISVM